MSSFILFITIYSCLTLGGLPAWFVALAATAAVLSYVFEPSNHLVDQPMTESFWFGTYERAYVCPLVPLCTAVLYAANLISSMQHS